MATATSTFNFGVGVLGLEKFRGDTKEASRSWQGVYRDTKRFSQQTILTRDAMRDFREEGSKLLSGLREIFPQFAGIAGLLGGGGLIAGLADLGRGFANTGTEIGNTSARLGVGVKLLTTYRRAADLVGDSVDDATSSFKGLAQNIFAYEHGQQSGIDAQRVAQKYGVTFARGKEGQTLSDLNRVFNSNPLLKNDPIKAQNVERAITGDAGLYDLLSKSPADFARLLKESGDTPSLTKEQIEDARRAHEAFSALTTAVGQLGLDLGAFTNKWLVPLETAMTKVINAVGKSPGATTAVDVGVTAIAGGIAAKLLGSVGKLVGVLPKGFAAGPVGFAVGAAILAAEIAQGAYRKYPGADPNKPFQDYLKNEGRKDKSAEAPRLLRDSLDALKRSIDSLTDFFGFGGGGGVAGLRRPQHGDVFGSGRPASRVPATDAVKSPVGRALIESIGGGETAGASDPYHKLYGRGSFSGNQFPSWFSATGPTGQPTSAAGRSQFERGTWQDEQRRLGLTDFSPANQDLATVDLAGRTYGGATAGRDLMADLQSGSLSTEGVAALRRVWPGGFNAGWEDRFRAALKSPLMPTAAEPAGGAAPGPQSSLDTKHHFVLDIRGAPPGTRGQMASADGPSTSEVKTSFALEGV